MTTSTKFLKHFRDLQAGESEKAGAAETLAYLNGSREIFIELFFDNFLFQVNYPFKNMKNEFEKQILIILMYPLVKFSIHVNQK